MKCGYPVILEKGRAVRCGQCVGCRIQKRKEWTNRIVLESSLYEDNTFVTLTYDEDHCPTSVSKGRLQKFIMDLRARIQYSAKKHETEPRKIRYFGVGEYGGESLRPHYHVMLFNFPNCRNGRSRYTKRDTECCQICAGVRNVWGAGNVYLGEVSIQSAAYVGGYVVKGWTQSTPVEGLEPEFTLKSNRPGIGHDFCWELASSLLQANATHVPFNVRHNGKSWPLGRYIRDKVSEYTGGLELEKAPADQRVHSLSEAIYADPEVAPKQKSWTLRERLIAPRYHQTQAMKKKLDKKRREQAL